MKAGGPPLLDLHDLGLCQTGNETWARGIARELFRLNGPRSYDVALTSAIPAADLAALDPRESVTVARSSLRRLMVDLPRAMRRLRTPVVLVQYTAPLAGVPAVVVVHDLSFEDPRATEWIPLPTRARYRASIRASVRRAAHVLTVSEYSRRDLVERYGLAPERVTVAPNAVDPRFAELVQATPEARNRRPTVLAVGNVLPRKNLGVVAQAVRLLRDRGEDVVLRVVGSVPASGRAQAEAVRARLGTAVEMTGYVTQAQLAREMRSAHVLVFPSLFEGFGIPVLEAMSADLPVVVADRTSLPEVVGNAGLVVPAEDPAAWADALHEVLNGAVGMRLAAAGRKRLREFDWRTSAATVSRVLASVGNP